MRHLLTGLFLVAVAAVPSWTQVVQRKLSGPMVEGVVGDVGEFVISPSGDRVLYQVFRRPEIEGGSPVTARVEVAATDGSGDPVVLSGDHANVSSLRWTPDETRAVFVAERSDGRHEIYSVPTDGSAPPTRLHTLATGNTVESESGFTQTVQLTSDGARVVYLLFISNPTNGHALYSAPIAGGATPERLTEAPFPDRGVESFLVSGSTVVFLGDQDTESNAVNLYSVPADGSASWVALTSVPDSHGTVQEGFAIDPSGTRVVYRASPPGQPRGLYTVPLDGSAAPLRLSPDLTAPFGVSSFRVSPDGAGVAYRVGQFLNNPPELFFVPIDGSAAEELLATGPAGGNGVEEGYEFCPDGTHVMYEADSNGAGASDGFFSVRVSDGSIAALHSTVVIHFRVAPDSSRVVFRVQDGKLYSAPLDGASPSVQIQPDFVLGGGIAPGADAFAVSADSTSVIYLADSETVDLVELYEVAIEPSGTPVATKLNHPLGADGALDRFRLAPDSSFVIYSGDTDGGGVVELFNSPGHLALSDPLPTGEVGDVSTFAAESGRVAYRADQDVAGKIELFGAPSDGSAAPVKLNETLADDREVRNMVLSPDGSTVVYRADLDALLRFELFSAPSDGSAAPVKLNGPLAPGGGVGSFFLISPDGSRVVYNADQADAPGYHLRSVPIHGGASVLLAPTGSFSLAMEITPDSTRVLSEVANDLFSVPIDGSAAPVNLSGAPTNVGEFEATPDGTRVVFTATSGGVQRLFSNAIDGGSLLDLSGGLGTAGDVVAFQLGVDGARVVYFGDTGAHEEFRLMSVPVDGSSSGVVLSGPLVAGGDVHDFEVSLDGVHVVYLADQAVNGSERLHRAPLDGSAPDVQLSTQDLGLAPFAIAPDGANIVVAFNGLRSLPITGGDLVPLSPDASEFVFLPGGRRVVHIEAGRLMLTPIGGGGSVALSPEPAGSILEFVLDGTRVVYRADQDSAGVLEIYSSWLNIPPVEHAPPSGLRSVTR